MAKNWDTNQYLKFKEERTQPSKDLISRLKEHQAILDIGSGPGNSTEQLRRRYPLADITGAECDDNMLEKARNNHPDYHFEKAFFPDDFYKFGKYDLIFSNACIHWIKDQKKLFEEIYEHLTDDGEIAIQIPLTSNSEFYRMLHQLIDEKYSNLNKVHNFWSLDKYGYYNLMQATGFQNITLWETNYCHHVADVDGIISWYQGSGLKPYLDIIGERKEEFLRDIQERITKQYTKLEDGTYFLIMPRLFMIATK